MKTTLPLADVQYDAPMVGCSCCGAEEEEAGVEATTCRGGGGGGARGCEGVERGRGMMYSSPDVCDEAVGTVVGMVVAGF